MDNFIQTFLSQPEDQSFQINSDLRLDRRPKLRINKLTDEKKIIPITIDIQIDQNTLIRERFDWNVGHDQISPQEFSEKFVQRLNLPYTNIVLIRNQIYDQLIKSIEKNTFFPRQHRQKEQELESKNNQQNFVIPQQIQNPLRVTERQKKLEKLKRKQMNYLNNNSHIQKRVCKFCKFCHRNLVVQCKNCKIPFNIIEVVNIRDVIIKQSLKYFQICSNKIQFVNESGLFRELKTDDFQSVQILKSKLNDVLKTEEFYMIDNETEAMIIQLDLIYNDLLNGVYDEKKSQPERNDVKDKDTNNILHHSINKASKRGRPWLRGRGLHKYRSVRGRGRGRPSLASIAAAQKLAEEMEMEEEENDSSKQQNLENHVQNGEQQEQT